MQALGVVVPEGKPDPKQPVRFERDPDKSVLVLDAAGVGLLLQRHWRGPGIAADATRQQIRRNRGFIGLARMLKLDPGIGAAQASFGRPAENGVAELADALDAARFELAGSPKTPRLAAAVREQEHELDAAVADLVVRTTRGGRRSKGLGKQTFHAQVDLGRADAYALAIEVMAAATQTPESREGIAAFLEKRPADFDRADAADRPDAERAP